ncbi:hypothetical protein C8R47DRAFT_673312 [Mycena vitilis]|nr:hypothetical protein C8R47DRAFT_673312 [Mycena vitilis]
MVRGNFAGLVPVDEFLETYLPQRGTESESAIADIVSECTDTLSGIRATVQNAKVEDTAAKEMITYLRKVVSYFPKDTRPVVGDTCHAVFKPLDEVAHTTMPDITLSQPGILADKKVNEILCDRKKWTWADAGTIVEAKHKIDIFDAKGLIANSGESLKALVQLAKNARSLLMASGSCHVYVTTAFARGLARIFRFDRTGFRATSAFNWLDNPAILPTFFFRLYHLPHGTVTRMDGQDDTISIPTSKDKQRMYDALCANSFYNKMYATEKDATEHSLWIKAVRFYDDPETKERVSKIVNCFTIGPVLSYADGLFSRATHVYRVILKEDEGEDPPRIYALKDVWRQACRRPETDFYDAIAKHYEGDPAALKGMAECHGSIDLSLATGDPAQTWNPSLHITRSTMEGDPRLERHHTRTLLTPVGTPLKQFTSTKSMVHALYTAVLQHRIAYEAGVLHRDVSEGNILFEEIVEPGEDPKGFLLDWDYAEFTQEGLKSFNKNFPGRADEHKLYEDIAKSLKDMTGTLPFMAIQILANNVAHAPHHDLESIYWVLVWMILRHTEHTNPEKRNACSRLFDPAIPKLGYLYRYSPVVETLPLFGLAEGLRLAVQAQNRSAKKSKWDTTPDPVSITYADFLFIFQTELSAPDWPTDDAAIPFNLPSVDPEKEEEKPEKGVKKSQKSPCRALDRGVEACS